MDFNGERISHSAAPEAHKFMKGFLEVFVGHGVYDGVDERVQISQPGEEVEQLGV